MRSFVYQHIIHLSPFTFMFQSYQTFTELEVKARGLVSGFKRGTGKFIFFPFSFVFYFLLSHFVWFSVSYFYVLLGFIFHTFPFSLVFCFLLSHFVWFSSFPFRSFPTSPVSSLPRFLLSSVFYNLAGTDFPILICATMAKPATKKNDTFPTIVIAILAN